MQFYKWFLDLESAMKSEVSDVLFLQECFVLCMFWLWDSWTYSSIVDRREIPTLCEHSNGADSNMWWYSPTGQFSIWLFRVSCSYLIWWLFDLFLILFCIWICWFHAGRWHLGLIQWTTVAASGSSHKD